MTLPKAIPNDLIDELLLTYKKPEDLIGENGLLKQLTKAVIERALQAEMAEHLGHGKHETVSNATGNTRNGRSRKTLKGDKVNYLSTFRVIEKAVSSRSSFPNTKRAGRALMTRLSLCTHAV